MQVRRVDTAALTELRAREPGRILAAWDERALRPMLADDGRLLLIAADHPARGALGVGSDPMAMASRSELLGRLVTALERPGVDGVLGTPDVLDDLLLLGALEGKVVIGSMNRGGLSGSAWELDDRFTAYTAREIQDRGLDGGKMLTRIALGDPRVAGHAGGVRPGHRRAGRPRPDGHGRALLVSGRATTASATSSTPTR